MHSRLTLNDAYETFTLPSQNDIWRWSLNFYWLKKKYITLNSVSLCDNTKEIMALKKVNFFMLIVFSRWHYLLICILTYIYECIMNNNVWFQNYSFVAPSVLFSENVISEDIFGCYHESRPHTSHLLAAKFKVTNPLPHSLALVGNPPFGTLCWHCCWFSFRILLSSKSMIFCWGKDF